MAMLRSIYGLSLPSSFGRTRIGLHRRRIGAADQDRRDDPDRHRADKEHDLPPKGIDREQSSRDERDTEQDVVRRDLRIHIRVRRALDDAARRVDEFAAVDPVAQRHADEEDHAEDGEMRAHMRRQPEACRPSVPCRVSPHRPPQRRSRSARSATSATSARTRAPAA